MKPSPTCNTCQKSCLFLGNKFTSRLFGAMQHIQRGGYPDVHGTSGQVRLRLLASCDHRQPGGAWICGYHRRWFNNQRRENLTSRICFFSEGIGICMQFMIGKLVANDGDRFMMDMLHLDWWNYAKWHRWEPIKQIGETSQRWRAVLGWVITCRP